MKLTVFANPEFPEVAREDLPWLAFLAGLAVEIGGEEDAVELSFVSDPEIAELNGRWRGREAPTDVLSFEYGDEQAGPDGDPVGEVIVSVETARRQAEREGHSTEEELSLLLVHGLHHIIGHDHEEEAQARRMAEAEEPFRRRLTLFFASPRKRSGSR